MTSFIQVYYSKFDCINSLGVIWKFNMNRSHSCSNYIYNLIWSLIQYDNMKKLKISSLSLGYISLISAFFLLVIIKILISFYFKSPWIFADERNWVFVSKAESGEIFIYDFYGKLVNVLLPGKDIQLLDNLMGFTVTQDGRLFILGPAQLAEYQVNQK